MYIENLENFTRTILNFWGLLAIFYIDRIINNIENFLKVYCTVCMFGDRRYNNQLIL